MRVAPIIHTRTHSCDFNSEFRVRPDIFFDSDIKWARNIVLEATSSIDSLQGERWIIADNGKYRMAGIVGFLKNICSKCDLSNEQKAASEELFCDDMGRLVYAFIGVVIDASDAESNACLTYNYLWNTFVNLIQPVWKRTYQEVITTSFEPYKFDGIVDKPAFESSRVGPKEMYEANPIMDYKLFGYYLCNKSINNFTFCTNITDINIVKECRFKIVTTSLNVITRLKRTSIPATTSTIPPVLTMKEVSSQEHMEEHEEGKKKLLIPLMICLLIFVIIILMLLLGNSAHATQLAALVLTD